MNLLTKGIGFLGLALTLGASAAAAADYQYRPTPSFAQGSIWTGLYVGVNGGYGGNVFTYPYSLVYANPAVPINETISGSAKINSSGFLGGFQAGYNWQYTAFVAGLEGDLDFAAINGRFGLNAATSPGSTFLGSAAASIGSKTTYIDTVRARVGYLISYQFLVYGTGGWAFGQTKNSVNANVQIPGLLTGSYSTSRSTLR